MKYGMAETRLHTFIPSLGPSSPRMTLPRSSRVRLNRLLAGVGLFRSIMHKWGLVSSVTRSCGEEEKTAAHKLASCLLYQPLNGALGLAVLDDETVDWLKSKKTH